MGIGALTTAFEGLNVAQRQLETISTNIANASTPGYTKKTLGVTSVITDNQAGGVVAGQISRASDPSLQYDLWQQNSISTASTTNESYLNQVQQLFGTPDSDSSVAASLTKLQSDYVALSADPSNSVYQTQVVNDAQQTASQYNKLSTNIQNLRNNAENDISTNVGQINLLLQQIASSNKQIVSINNAKGDPSNVEDQRDQDILQLSQYMNISTYSSGNGSVTVQTASGTILADTDAQALSFTPTPQTPTTYYPASANGIMLNGSDITSQIKSGSVGQLITMRDQTLPQAQAMLDESAHQLASRFSAQGTMLFTNSAGTVPNNTPANYVGFSSQIQVNTVVAGDPTQIQDGTGGGTVDSGDNTNILKVLDYTFGTTSDSSGTAQTPFNTTGLGASGNLTINLPGGGSILSYTQSLISTLAQQYSQASSDKTYQQNYNQTLTKNFQDETGVSIDDEMTNLISVQQSYSASARMITTVSQMFTQLLSSVQ